MTIILYGIPNCDTVKKARSWLEDREIVYAFHDYKKSGADADRIKAWCTAFGWETILNRAGTTYRKLPDTDKSGLDEAKAIGLMVGQPSMVRRPVVEHPSGILIGFKPEEWEILLG